MTKISDVIAFTARYLMLADEARKGKLTTFFLAELKNIQKLEQTNTLVVHQNTLSNQNLHTDAVIDKLTSECFGGGGTSIRHQKSDAFKEIFLYSAITESFQQLLTLLQDEAFVAYMEESGVVLPQHDSVVTMTMLSDLIPEIVDCVSKKLAQDKEKIEALYASSEPIQFIGWALTMVACALALVSIWPAILVSAVGVATMMTGIYQNYMANALAGTYDQINAMLQPVVKTENQKGYFPDIQNSILEYLKQESDNNEWNAQDIDKAYRQYNLFSPSYLQYGLNDKQPKDLRREFLDQEPRLN